MKTPNPHEAPLGKFLRALARPVDPRPYYMARDGSMRQKSHARQSRRFIAARRQAKVIHEPASPRRSWADVQAAWRRRKEAE